MTKNYYMGQEVLYPTTFFDKPYYCMKDADGTIYFVKMNEDGTPDFS